MRITLYGSRPYGAGDRNPMNKGNETGDIQKDGYRVISRAPDDYRRDVRREAGECSHHRIFAKDE
jgi:hypothetical protein